MENRVEILRAFLDDLVKNKERGELRFVERHMFAVSNFAAMIALKRDLNPEIAVMIGLLHDIHTLLNDDPANHAELSGLKAEAILKKLNIVTDTERAIICTAVKNHSAKKVVHDDYDELIKDADVLSHYFFNTALPPAKNEQARLEKLMIEFGLKIKPH